MKSVRIAILMLALAVTGCNKKDNAASKATSSNSDFDRLYGNLAASNVYQERVSMDLQVHAYTFEISAPHTITQIGYKTLPGMDTIPYLMEIYDSTSSVMIYSGYHTFSSAATSYVSIAPIPVTPGHLYIIRRIQTSVNLSYTIGRLLLERNPGKPFSSTMPRTSGDLTITGSLFYGKGGPIYDIGLPYIDLIYK